MLLGSPSASSLEFNSEDLGSFCCSVRSSRDEAARLPQPETSWRNRGKAEESVLGAEKKITGGSTPAATPPVATPTKSPPGRARCLYLGNKILEDRGCPGFSPFLVLFSSSAWWVQSPPVASGRRKVQSSPQPHKGHSASLVPSPPVTPRIPFLPVWGQEFGRSYRIKGRMSEPALCGQSRQGLTSWPVCFRRDLGTCLESHLKQDLTPLVPHHVSCGFGLGLTFRIAENHRLVFMGESISLARE